MTLAISGGGYTSILNDTKLQENLTRFFNDSIANNKDFRQLHDIKTITEWYSQVREYRKQKTKVILSMVINNIVEKLIEYAIPLYTDSIVNKVGVETQFKEGTVETNFEIGFRPIRAHVEFVKRLNGNKVNSTKFQFELDTRTYIKKLRIARLPRGLNGDGKSLDIEKMGVELELYLDQVVSAVNYLTNPIKLGSQRFELKHISFRLRSY